MKEKKLENLNEVKELLVIIDMNNGFTREGVFKNPYMEQMIQRVNKLAQEFGKSKNKSIILVNEAHESQSQEFKTFPEHCVRETSEAQIVEELKWIENKYKVFHKNCTMAIFAPGLLEYYDKLTKLQKVFFAGGVTDICLLEGALPTKKYFDQKNRDIEVVVPTDVVDTYDAPWHNRQEYNEMTFKFMEQAGIKVLRK